MRLKLNKTDAKFELINYKTPCYYTDQILFCQFLLSEFLTRLWKCELKNEEKIVKINCEELSKKYARIRMFCEENIWSQVQPSYHILTVSTVSFSKIC